jgi:glycosyltransferase involved in cell wall biosynthesis
LVIVATHPIQYHAPLFRALAVSDRLRVSVAFLDIPDSASQGVGFGKAFQWDVPLTEGYAWVRLDAAIATGSGSNRFLGRRARSLTRQLGELAPDVVLVMGWNQFGLLQAWFAAKRLGLPLLVRGDSNAKRPRPAWKRWVHRVLLGVPDGFLSVGESNARFYCESGVPAERIQYAPHFVDNAFFASRAAVVDRVAVHASWGISEGDVCVLFAGKFEAIKRPFDLLAAVTVLPAKVRRRIAVLMVGAGPLGVTLRQQADAAGLRVTWVGFLNQSEIPEAYAVADMLVLPSEHETWGLVVNEAMACGVPAIVSDLVGCANDLVRPGETGMVFPMGDVAALAKAIEALASNPERRRAMGEAARALVTREYTVVRCQRALEAIVAGCSAA